MKANILSLSLGLTALAGLSSPGLAGGDYTYAGVREYSAATPVPAPIPVPMYHPLWYFRVDGGLAFGGDVDATQSGMSFGSDPVTIGGNTYTSATPFSVGDEWLTSDYTSSAVWNLGIGYYLTRNFRTDLTVESRRDQEVIIDGVRQSDLMINGLAGVAGTDTYDVTVSDRTLVRGAVFMLNGYYDLAEWGPIRPYIGGGIGFAVTDLERRSETQVSAIDSLNVGLAPMILQSESTVNRKQVTSTAASATVGFTYDVTDITQFDFGYRFLWVEGVHTEIPVNGRGSRIEIDDTTEHQFRAGLRFNVY